MIQELFFKGRRPYLWITVLVVIVYAQILFFGLTYLDDNTLIVDNQALLGNPENLFRVFSVDFMAPVSGGYYFRPLLSFTLILNAIIGGSAMFIYHFTDLLLHLGAALLLYRFLLNISHRQATALVGSLIFAVHPVLVQTVAWVPARNDSLVALFTLLSLVAFQELTSKPQISKKYFALHLSAFTLALLSKEIAVMIPGIAAVYWLLFRFRKTSAVRHLLVLIPFWLALLAGWYLLRQNLVANAASYNIRDALGSVYFNAAAVMAYIGKMVFPVGLSTYPVLTDVKLTAGFIALTLLGLAFLLSRNKRLPAIVFGASWFFIFLIPSLVRPNYVSYSEILEHRLYLPFVGFLIAILEIDVFKLNFFENKKRLAVVGLLLTILAALNIAHARNFVSGAKYWSRAVETSPHSSFAHKQLGAMNYLFTNDKAEAERLYKIAIQLNPEETLVQSNLGLIYADRGEFKEAEIFYKKEIAINPNYDKVHFNLGHLYYRQKRYSEAEQLWLKTASLNPLNILAYQNLAAYYYEQKQYEKGVEQLKNIIRFGGTADEAILNAYRPYLR